MNQKIFETILPPVVTASFALIGTFLGIFLPNFFNFIKNREQKNIEVNRIIFNVLELWFLYYTCDAKKLIYLIVNKLKSKFPNDDIVQNEQLIIKTIEDLIGPTASKFTSTKFDSIKNDYKISINKLSEIDPVLAFKLRGLEGKYDDIGFLEKYLNKFESEFSGHIKTIAELKHSFSTKIEFYENEIAKDIEKNLLNVTFKLNIISFFKIKLYLRQFKSNYEKSIQKELSELVDGIILFANHENKMSNEISK